MRLTRILQGRLPNGDTHELFAPARALKGFHEHEAALDAIIWSVEEADGALARILANQGGGRFTLTEEQSRAYHEAREEAAHCGMEGHNVRTPEINRCLQISRRALVGLGFGGPPPNCRSLQDLPRRCGAYSPDDD